MEVETSVSVAIDESIYDAPTVPEVMAAAGLQNPPTTANTVERTWASRRTLRSRTAKAMRSSRSER